MGNIVEALQGVDLLAWQKGANYNMRRHTMEDHTSWASGNLSLQHFAQEHKWVWVLDENAIAGLMRRWDRACHLSEVNVTSRGHDYQVTSQTDSNIHYIVDLEKGCTCPDALKATFGWCKHRLAAWQYQKYLDQQQERHRASLEYSKRKGPQQQN